MSQVSTPPISKGKEKAAPPPTISTMKSITSQAYRTTPATASVTQGSNLPPVTTISQTTYPVRSPPKPFDGKSENAITFCQVLDNYYTMNSAVFPNKSK